MSNKLRTYSLVLIAMVHTCSEMCYIRTKRRIGTVVSPKYLYPKKTVFVEYTQLMRVIIFKNNLKCIFSDERIFKNVKYTEWPTGTRHFWNGTYSAFYQWKMKFITRNLLVITWHLKCNHVWKIMSDQWCPSSWMRFSSLRWKSPIVRAIVSPAIDCCHFSSDRLVQFSQCAWPI